MECQLMVEMLDSNALGRETRVSKIKTVAMDRRFLIVMTAIISFACGAAIKQPIWRDDTVKPLRIIELPPIPPGAELSLSGAAQ